MGGLCPPGKPGPDASAELEEEQPTMEVGDGVRMLRSQYLAGFRAESYPTVPMLQESAGPRLDGTIDDVARAHPELEPVLYNNVKVCPRSNCSKACAFTLRTCNSCGASLDGVEIGKSDNVFVAFLLGVAKAKAGFPYTISLRSQTEDVLVFDDLLALTPCHLNAIPRRYHIPDWRFLLRAPAAALQLLDTMEAACWAVTQQFLKRDDFRKKIFRKEISDEDLRKHIIVSFNFPPSQFQLHIQWLVPPLLPFQHYMAETGNHFHEGRAFPMSYVREVLALNEPYDVQHSTPIQEILDFYKGRGVDYSACWRRFFNASLRSTMELQNWSPKDFQWVVQDGAVHEFSVADGCVEKGAERADLAARSLQEQDKLALQNYGRPYSAAGKATGTYVKAPLEPTLGPGGFSSWPKAEAAGQA